MDQHNLPSVSDFFDLNKKFEKVKIRPGAVMGREIAQKDFVMQSSVLAPRTSHGQGYAKQYIEEENKKLLQGPRFPPIAIDLPGPERSLMGEMEDLTSVATGPNLDDVDSQDWTRIYDLYDFTPQCSDLAIEGKRELIVKMVETNQAVILVGATGCGKTTKVPQFILDHHAKMKTKCNIIVTQPRRIAAKSVADRVCRERNWALSTIVGYQVGLDNKTSPDTRLTYCTTGVLREKLVRDKTMMPYTHVIIDEVHERELETDFLMLVVRKLLRTNSRTVKVILMSATIDPAHFADYFSILLGDMLMPAPVLEIEKYTNYAVDEFYIEHLQQLGNIPEFNMAEPVLHEEAVEIAVRLIMYFDVIDLKTYKIRHGDKEPTGPLNKPAVLVFLPGIHEIETLYERLDAKRTEQNKFKWHLIPLHSSISKEEQMKVFCEPLPGYRKVILSTNIAESSITVTEVEYVIDFCLTKHLMCDPVTNFTSLRLAWAAHSNCKQRAGRAGRVKNGRVYRMVLKSFYEDEMQADSEPEMIRCPLSTTVLKAKLLKMGGPEQVLALAIDPPDLGQLQTTVLLLKEAGALLMTCDGKPSELDGDMTFLGSVMSNLPLDIQLSKLIMLGHIFSILDEAIVMAAWMTVRSVFKTDFHDKLGPYGSKICFTGGSSSDCIAYLHVHQVFTEKLRTNYFKTSNDNAKAWCKRNFLNLRAMNEANELVEELRRRLKNIGVYERAAENRPRWNENDLPIIRKVVLAGAFYPNYFVRSDRCGQIDEENAVKTLAGKDPFSTVYLHGFPSGQHGVLYRKFFKDFMEKYAGVVSDVSFDGSTKVYIEFERKTSSYLPGKITDAVYRAIRMRQLRIPIFVPLLDPEIADERMVKLGVVSNRNLCIEKLKNIPVNPLLSSSVQDIEFVPCYVKDPNKFFIHSGVEANLKSIQTKINTKGNIGALTSRPKVGFIYAAPYPIGAPIYYRARVTALDKNSNFASVYFIDYGNSDDGMPLSCLRELTPNIQDLKSPSTAPALALECSLAHIGPSSLSNENGVWSKQSIERFEELLSEQPMFGEIFSVVDGVLTLIVKRGTDQKSVNDILVDEGLAESVQESYRSKVDHDKRVQARGDSSENCSVISGVSECAKVIDISDVKHNLGKADFYVDPPRRDECTSEVRLRGPSSPLEMKVYGCTRKAEGKDVSMDLDSVNCVLLDSSPQDPHERLLVAGYVGANSNGSKVKLMHTTLMPNMWGLSALMSLLFAPRIELRVSQDKERYIGAICGLGYNKNTHEAFFPENDIEVQFDCAIDFDDIDLINKIRYYMSKPLMSVVGDEICDATPAEIVSAQIKVSQLIIRLLSRNRPTQDVEFFSKVWQWNQFDIKDVISWPSSDERSVYPSHNALFLKSIDQNKLAHDKY